MDLIDMTDQKILYTEEIDDRLAELKTHDEWEQEDWQREDDEFEAAELQRFKDDFGLTFGRCPGLINESYWDQYAAEQARDIYGEAADTDYWDGKKWSERLKGQFTEYRLDGAVFYCEEF